MKFIILGILLYAIYYIFFKKPVISQKKTKDNLKQESETMVECTKCKAYVSVNEALIVDGKYFCSKECADAYNRI